MKIDLNKLKNVKTQLKTESIKPIETIDNNFDCMICKAKLVYGDELKKVKCAICNNEYETKVTCENGHYICDSCHSLGGVDTAIKFISSSDELDPMKILETVMSFEKVHMHGPEHHTIVPLCLIKAAYNNGAKIDIDKAIKDVISRTSKVPGGACGYWGACGAAVGAGIFYSILTGASPLTTDTWADSQKLVSICLNENANIGGPRCCKRTSRTAIINAVKFVKEKLGIDMPVSVPVCDYMKKNRECIGKRCPYFPE